MIDRGQVFVRGLNVEGKWDTVDALDLDDESFRRFVLNHLHRVGSIVALRPEAELGDDRPRPLRARKKEDVG